jgi:hypothetical protein
MNKFLLLVILFTLNSCGEDDDKMISEMPDPLKFENVKIFDANGLPLGCHPICDEDWTNFKIENTGVLNWDYLTLATSKATSPVEFFGVYPNPFNKIQAVYVNAPEEYQLLLEIIDEEANSYLQLSQKTNAGSFNLNLNYEGLGILNDKLYRVYYKIINADRITIFEGHGDIFGCEIPTDYLSCFPN